MPKARKRHRGSSEEHAVKSERLHIRLSADQKARLQHAAEMEGQTLSDFVVESALRHAENVIREGGVLRLSASDSRAFVQALLDPPPPSTRMRALAAQYTREVAEM